MRPRQFEDSAVSMIVRIDGVPAGKLRHGRRLIIRYNRHRTIDLQMRMSLLQTGRFGNHQHRERRTGTPVSVSALPVGIIQFVDQSRSAGRHRHRKTRTGGRAGEIQQTGIVQNARAEDTIDPAMIPILPPTRRSAPRACPGGFRAGGRYVGSRGGAARTRRARNGWRRSDGACPA